MAIINEIIIKNIKFVYKEGELIPYIRLSHTILMPGDLSGDMNEILLCLFFPLKKRIDFDACWISIA